MVGKKVVEKSGKSSAIASKGKQQDIIPVASSEVNNSIAVRDFDAVAVNILSKEQQQQIDIQARNEKVQKRGRPTNKKTGKIPEPSQDPAKAAQAGKKGRGINKKAINIRSSNAFSVYIYRTLKAVHPEMGISKQSMNITNLKHIVNPSV